jgi:hypothetical protein
MVSEHDILKKTIAVECQVALQRFGVSGELVYVYDTTKHELASV